MVPFSGSYLPEDVQILLKPIAIETTPLQAKERLIQQGQKHYSEMLTKESLPSSSYLALFFDSLRHNKQRMAYDLLYLAAKIHQQKPNIPLVLCSLARAGTPIGVLLKRILQQYFHRECQHYSLSIIRDRGIDNNALRYILERHSQPSSVTFIDGWTGKGVINTELQNSIRAFNHHHHTAINSDLYVLNDIAGVAATTVSYEDYLIPSSLLNATISGLISRSILNKAFIQADDFHGCYYYTEFQNHDLSRWFIEDMMFQVALLKTQKRDIESLILPQKQRILMQAQTFIDTLKHTYLIQDVNLIKCGIGEATRVLLRRIPDVLLLKDLHAPQTRHLVLLATEKNIPICHIPTMPYQATAIIAAYSHHD
jgi:Phosphoribosyl transferase (PRTase)/PELOTA RNA binding domain